MPQWFPVAASTVLALIPVIIWLRIIHREGEQRSLFIKTFLFGTLAVIPPFVLIFAFEWFPQFNIYSLINRSVEEVALAALLTNVIVGVVEELAKNLIVRIIDKRHPEYLQTLGSVLKLSICAGLGFAFAENIFYFYNVWTHPEFGFADLFSTFVFRSIFTMCGHMVFSGIFGYFYGMGKFAADLTEYARWQGHKMYITRFISRLTGRMPFEALREEKILTGLFLAMTIHASFNVSLDLEYKLPSILIVAVSALYIAYLLQRKSGHMLFSIIKRRASSMAPKDQDVVMELLGMWTREGRLAEVIEICNRMLERDPDNNVVKLFRAKAMDNAELKHFYGSLKELFTKGVQQKSAPGSVANTPTLKPEDEKVALEVMRMWTKEGKEKEALTVAKNLLARNPESSGAQLLMQKTLSREKLENVFENLSKLFSE